MKSSEQEVIAEKLIQGKFLSEDKNRFLCTVDIDGNREQCYISSSCRLDNFIELYDKTVLLSRTRSSTAATRYAVMAVKHKRSYILLNTSLANKALQNSIKGRRFSFLGKRRDVQKEQRIDDYKSDFYIPSQKKLIEVKSVISTQRTAIFPTVYSERALRQLDSIHRLLEKGYKAVYLIISLNPYVERIEIDTSTEFYVELENCLQLGMELKAMACRLKQDGCVYISNSIAIEQKIIKISK